MDFGVLGLDGLVGPENIDAPSQVSASETKTKILESGSVKHGRSFGSGQDDWGSLKMARTDDVSVPKSMPLHQTSGFLRSNVMVSGGSRQQEHMLSFSSPKPEAARFLNKNGGFADRSAQNINGFPYYQQTSSAYSRSGGYGTGSLHGPFARTRGPFTPSQLMELEHQALIYKYMAANVPVPSNLLIPLKKSMYPYSLLGASLGGSTFHLGYAGNIPDPEPGRCRRTDGKKWRCSRDAVADQKYCERHINRGRHRSRKPVEGQPGHAGTMTTKSKMVPIASSMSTTVLTNRDASNTLAVAQQQFKSLQPPTANSPTNASVNRGQDTRGKTIVSSKGDPKSEGSTPTILEQDTGIVKSPSLKFGLVSSDFLGNPSYSSYMNTSSYDSFLNFSDQETEDQHLRRRFMDDCSKDQGSNSVISWPKELKSDWTQLSMSIPMSSTDFSSSSSFPTQDKLMFSPLKLSREFEPIQKTASWTPISWGTSVGGPLGEVLSTTTGNARICKSSSDLNVSTERWDGSLQLGYSPTGVLQKAMFVSLSNSSSGSSPRAEGKKNNDGASFYEDVLSSTIVSSSL
ncbi:hypothetical protein K2173_002496 [Erythroxylum novogranatense]|uniref:Growth-regulating factor n=1 Tax=Erythroxylum novogranatense TaxID=1862640 RepID=A0AAV8TQX0_9ROSI|nr:hypothetical protein K2173_002496 [Erythroxylum novogranatense]